MGKMKRENFHIKEFGENVWFFAPEDDREKVQETLDFIYARQEANQFGTDRDAVYFLPGNYSDMEVNVGFYTHVAGLGIVPGDVVLPSLQCTARWNQRPGNHNACCNFWRGAENLTLESDTMWAVSQATYLRRIHIKKDLYLHDEGGWASGGFAADILVDGMVDSGTQQQWLSRNCDWKQWMGCNWNIVFSGIPQEKTPVETWPQKAYTTVGDVEVMQEKPFLVYLGGEQSGERQNRRKGKQTMKETRRTAGFGVYVPSVRHSCRGISWAEKEEGCVIPMEEFYIARADRDTSDTLNRALEEGKHLFFTPGIYELDKELVVRHENAVILATGFATLLAVNGNRCMRIRGEGATIAGILFDAGEKESETLLLLEKAGGEDYTWCSDLFFRVGGAASGITRAHTCIVIDRNYVVGDNFWIWRADHGHYVDWDRNPSANGIVVNGDYVTLYALMVEHFEEYQTVWNGEYGKVIMYQSEVPYDVPAGEVWMSHEGRQKGYPSYYVAEHVKHHEAWGIGVYTVNRRTDAWMQCVMEVPETPDVKVHNICAIMITGYPGICHVINNVGGSCESAGERQIITEWPPDCCVSCLSHER